MNRLTDIELDALADQVAIARVQSPSRYREEERAGVQLLAAADKLFAELRELRAENARVAALTFGDNGVMPMLIRAQGENARLAAALKHIVDTHYECGWSRETSDAIRAAESLVTP